MVDDEPRSRRSGCGCLGAVLAAVLFAVGGYAFAAGFFGSPSLLSSRLTGGLELPSEITSAAQVIESTVATSARSLGSMPGALSTKNLRITYPHITPEAGKAVASKPQTFRFDGVKYSITPHVASDVYWGARHSTRLMAQLPGESNASWTQAYYHAFADDAAQAPAIDDVALQLRAIRDRAHLDSDQYLELIAKYVQTIPYDWATYKAGNGRQRFPVEVLVEDRGMCGDKSVLLADLLAHEGYAASLLEFGPEKHMAVGVLGSGTTYAQSGYLFLETTAPCYVTDVPTEYSGGMHLHSEPVVVAIGSGTLTYAAADEIGKIIAVRDSAADAAKKLYKKAKGQLLDSAQVADVNRRLNQAYKAETSFRSNVVDQNGKSVGTFMDRTQALRWIDGNAWWL